MIRESVKIHDRFQFEMKQIYSFTMKGWSNRYHVKTYFFIPKNFRISSDNYGSDQFFSDLHSYIRMKTPTYTLRQLAEDPETHAKLHRSIETSVDPKNKGSAGFSYHARIFSVIFKKAMKRSLTHLQSAGNDRERSEILKNYLGYVRRLINGFRELETIPHFNRLPQRDREIYRNADEYVSLKIHSRTFRMLDECRKEWPDLYHEYRDDFLKLVSSEQEYRIKKGYPTIIDPETDNNRFIFRQGILKKYMSSILFLDTRFGRSADLIRHIIYSLAAGVAMVFATSVAFYGQNRFGNFSYPFFVALVISYMFKDRIKDILKLYLNRRITTWLYDRVRNVYHAGRRRIGFFKESFNYIDKNDIPEPIRDLRKTGPRDELDMDLLGEEVILYRKYLKLKNRRFRKIPGSYDSDGILDILRFNITSFIKNLDDPEKKLYNLRDHSYEVITAARVYHLNVISHYRFGKQDYYRRLKIILSRKGIEKITEMADDSETN